MNINRQPAGQPTGGQFAEGAKAGASITLTENKPHELRCACGVLLDIYADPNAPDMCTYCTDEEIGEGPCEKDADAYGTDVTEPFIPVSTIEGLAQDGQQRTIYLSGGDTLEYREHSATGTSMYVANIKDIADGGFDHDAASLGSTNWGITKEEHYRAYLAQKDLYSRADLTPDNGYIVHFSTPTTLNIAPCMDSYQGDVTPEAVSVEMDEQGQVTGGSVETEWGTVQVDATHAESILSQAAADMGSANLRESVAGAISRAHQ